MQLWLGAAPLILASRSAVRHAILAGAGVPHVIKPADIDERMIESRAGAGHCGEVADLLAREKAVAVSTRHAGSYVLGADQTLALGEQRFSKPANAALARKQLACLRGRTHELHSAIAVVRDGKVIFQHRERARLTMREFTDEFLDAYLAATGAGATASVGGYQLEGHGIQLFERIEGDYFVILGLPLLPLLQCLRREGLLAA
ncbi:MAG TPA: Maf family protein [Xanthobacteraceae bacterium]|jgi:septum formation protein